MERLVWRKSSHSSGQGSECVEVARWRKSSHSYGDNNDCVELADLQYGIAVRDSKDPDGSVLLVGRGAWAALVQRIQR